MQLLLSFLLNHWVDILAVIGTVGHAMPEKTVAHTIGSAAQAVADKYKKPPAGALNE